MRLEGKVAIVTGGAAGIGRAICEVFAEEGAKVVIGDIDSDGGRETVELIENAGGSAVFVPTDVSQESKAQALVERAVSELGEVNILVNDAAAFVFGQVQDVSDADWQRVLGVNVLGPSYMVKHVLEPMKAGGGGSIVNIASVSSFIAQPAFVPYNTSKGALLQLTRCLAMDLAPDKVPVGRGGFQLHEALWAAEGDSLRRALPGLGRVVVHDGPAANH